MAKKKALLGQNANYDFKNHAPQKAMGTGSFANLPDQPMFKSFSGEVNMRDGIQNNPVMSVDMTSEVDENMRE